MYFISIAKVQQCHHLPNRKNAETIRKNAETLLKALLTKAFHAVFPFLRIFSALGLMCLVFFFYICIMLD